MGAIFQVVVDDIPFILARLGRATADICLESAEEIAQFYRDNAPRESGFMASSAYVKTSDSSTYGQNLEGDGPMFPEADAPKKGEAIAAVAAAYWAFVEFGTVHQAAQPTFMRAVDAARPGFQDKLSNIEQRVKKA